MASREVHPVEHIKPLSVGFSSGGENSIFGRTIPEVVILRDGEQSMGPSINPERRSNDMITVSSDTSSIRGRAESPLFSLGSFETSKTDLLSLSEVEIGSSEEVVDMNASVGTILGQETGFKSGYADESEVVYPSDFLPESGDIVEFDKKKTFESKETAEGYYETTPKLDEEYLGNLQGIFIPETDSGKGYTLIDIGSGDGLVALKFATRYKDMKVIAIDPSEHMIKMAKAREEKNGQENKLDLRNIRVEDLPPEEEYDGIFLHDTIHLLDNPEESISKLAKKLKPGGKLVIGSVMYAFDLQEGEKVFQDVFNEYGLEVEMGDWSSVKYFKHMSAEGLIVRRNELGVPASYTPDEIAAYARNVSMTNKLSKTEKDRFEISVGDRFRFLVGDSKYTGEDVYSLIIGTKKPNEA